MATANILDEDILEVKVISHYKCPICEQEESSASKIELHVNQVHFGNEPPILSCPFCSKSFTSHLGVEQHVTDRHPETSDSEEPPESAPPLQEMGAAGGTFGNSDESGMCPVCCRKGFTDDASLADHLEEHFNKNILLERQKTEAKAVQLPTNADHMIQQALADEEFAKFQAAHGMGGRLSHKDQSQLDLERAAYRGEIGAVDVYERRIKQVLAEKRGEDDNTTRTDGIIERLRPVCLQWRDVKRVHLCTYVSHFSGTYGDRGWGCGYRNTQMLLSSLQHCPQYQGLLGAADGAVPSIPSLQRRIEAAWDKGFDVHGRDQLGGKVLGTRKWIGATELVALLSSMRIKCELVDFHSPSGPGSTHPALFQWCLQHFSRPNAFIPPLYLQHQGHSRTVIGCEELNGASSEENPPIRLLILDPSHSPYLMSPLAATQMNSRETLGENNSENTRTDTRESSLGNTKGNSRGSFKENTPGSSSSLTNTHSSGNTMVGYTLSGDRVVHENSDWGRGRGRGRGRGGGRGRGRGGGGEQNSKGPVTVAATLRALRKPLRSLCKDQYQIVAVVGLIESEEEFQRSKVLTSTRVPKT